MKKTYFKPLVAITALAVTFTACGGGDTTGNDSLATNDSATDTDTTVVVQQFAQVPSPGEMFSFMKMVGAQNAKGDILNPADNQKKYESKKAQGLNFGVYAADMLYCSTFGLGSQALKYFATVKTMGDKLQVSTAITKADEDRINKNIGNSDTLAAISNDKYYSAFANMESNQRGGDLSLMLAGGWIESMYLMNSMVKDFDKDAKAVSRIAEQQYALNNLSEYMTKYESNPDVASVLTQINALKQLFDGIQSGGASENGMAAKNGKRVLGGGSKLSMTKEQFEAIKAKVTEIRTSFISAQ